MLKSARGVIVVACLAVAGCVAQARPTPSPKTDETMTETKTKSETKTNEVRSVTVRGNAGNAKAGAEISGKDGTPVYVAGLDAWPAALNGKMVGATGTLHTVHHELPVGPNGEHYAGLDGDQLVLRDARYGLVQEGSWKRGIGGVTTVSGKAADSKWGAVIVTPEGPCYVNGLKAWPADVVGQPVSATGDVQRNKRATGPEQDDAHLGGQPGEKWALGDPRWSSP